MNDRNFIQHTVRYGVFCALTCLAGLVWCSAATAQTISDYTAVPPFVSQTAAPNILLLLDNSSSMQEMAFPVRSVTFDPTHSYSGIFDPTECYEYDDSTLLESGHRKN